MSRRLSSRIGAVLFVALIVAGSMALEGRALAAPVAFAPSAPTLAGIETNNPYVLDRNPCGSSSGSAAAVAANLAPVAIGTETWGSIMCPAGANGVVGIKPGVGLVSRTGIVPISPAQDTAGPLARNETDASIVLSAIQGTDDRDPATDEAAAYVGRDYRRTLKRNALRGRRIGLWRNGEGPDVERVLDETAAVLRRAAATVIETPLDETVLFDPTFNALVVEFKPSVNAPPVGDQGAGPGVVRRVFGGRVAARM